MGSKPRGNRSEVKATPNSKEVKPFRRPVKTPIIELSFTVPGIEITRYICSTERIARIILGSPSSLLQEVRMTPGIIEGNPPAIPIGKSLFQTGEPAMY